MIELITGIGISLASYHFDRSVEHNEFNPGIFVELDHDYLVGVYRNSKFRTTVLAARRFTLVESGSVNIGAFGGLCTGYGVPVCAGLSARLGYAEFIVTPPVGQYTSGAVALTIRVPYGTH